MEQPDLTKQSVDLLVAVLAASPDIVIVIDGRGVVSFANEAARRVLGHAPEDWLGRSAIELVHPDDQQRVLAELRTRVGDPDADLAPVELRIADLAGEWVPVEAHGIRPVRDGAVAGMVVVLRDITARLATEQYLASARHELAYVVSHDRLTRLPNRSRVELHLDRLARGRPDSLIGRDILADLIMVKVVDIDSARIKYGAAETDAIVRALGERVRSEVGAADFVGTTGDGEFVVAVEWMPRGLEDLADRLQALADTALSSLHRRVDINLAVGVAPLYSGMSADEALGQLAQAAGWAIRTGSRQPVVFDDRLRDLVRQWSQIATDVERGLAAGEFELHYQPIRSIRTGRIDMFEALIRWHHPEAGLLPAGRFLPAVEGTAVMLDIGEHVVAEACATLGRWQRRFGPRAPGLAMNVSARQLRQGDFAASVQRALDANGADPLGLSVELTETHALEGEQRAAGELARLRRLGVKIALDDFGTGYSSLRHLQKIGADVVKIDRSFVESLGVDDGATAIVRAAIDLADAFGAVTVAEGVTTEQQHQLLRSMGCQRIQGFLIAPALAPAVADALIEIEIEIESGPVRDVASLSERSAVRTARLAPGPDGEPAANVIPLQLRRRLPAAGSRPDPAGIERNATSFG